MGRNRKIGTVLVTAVLAAGTYFATSASASTPNSPGGTDAATATATTPGRVFAVVNADGTEVRGRALASSSQIGRGLYDVRFRRNITTCAWTGTVGIGTTPFGGALNGSMISVSGRGRTNNGLFVQTFDAAGAPTDLPFLVVVVCS